MFFPSTFFWIFSYYYYQWKVNGDESICLSNKKKLFLTLTFKLSPWGCKSVFGNLEPIRPQQVGYYVGNQP